MIALHRSPASHAIGIREAADADLHSIMMILNHEIIESPYVYAEAAVTLDERRAWLEEHRAHGLAVLVAVEDGIVRGWGSLSPYRSASGYRFTVEPSVYVAAAARGRGIARTLLTALHEAAIARNAHASVASIDAENLPSITLFLAFGYREVARLPEVGRKFDHWRTQLLLLRELG